MSQAASPGPTRRDLLRRALALTAAATAAGRAAGAFAAAQGAKVVVIGGGAGGATVARLLATASPEIEVTLVTDSATYVTGFFSNLFLAGSRSLESLTQSYGALQDRFGVRLAIGRATGIDGSARRVVLADGTALPYDRLVVAPGIDFRSEEIEGYSAAAAEELPHAWHGGAQLEILRNQLLAMEDGGTFVICAPPNPYRCPPGPYERASAVAGYFAQHKPNSKILVLDAKNQFALQTHIERSWARFHPGMIEWLPAEMTDGGVRAVNAATREIVTTDETFEAAVANVIPAQSAGAIARDAGLADASGWCPVDPATLASGLMPDVYLLGDAIAAEGMPKSASAATGQARLCVNALLSDLTQAAPLPVQLQNFCWAFLAEEHAVLVGAEYAVAEAGYESTHPFISELDESDEIRAATAAAARSWYDATVEDIFG